MIFLNAFHCFKRARNDSFTGILYDEHMKEATMKKPKLYGFKWKVWVPVLIILVLLAPGSVYLKSGRQGPVSEFGKYQGYSEELYNGTQR